VRLTELEPQWLERGGARVGVMFRCPCSRCGGSTRWLTVFWVGMPIWGERVAGRYAGQMGYIREALDRLLLAGVRERAVVPCRDGYAWTRAGDDFNSLTIMPSLDASRSGDWHGFISNGEVR
jgi:hypothetical protein